MTGTYFVVIPSESEDSFPVINLWRKQLNHYRFPSMVSCTSRGPAAFFKICGAGGDDTLIAWADLPIDVQVMLML